ncbi:MAG: efflux RND transporter permease subunit, partial [Schwartzia sp.]|nr:efflux RND transporter permease subunit [Schwartzia sp. (in: firmicutes)]
MTGFFIRHPLPAIVAALLLTIFGLLSAFSLPVAQYPEIAPPTVMVSTTYIGADAEVLNDTVEQVIENEVNGVEGIDYMKSTSDSSGAYYLEIVFRPEIDGDTAAVKVQNRISSALPQLPDEVQSYGVSTTKSSEDMALVISLISPKGSYDSMFLKNYAQVYFMDKIKRVYGVGSVTEYTDDFAMRIWLNPEKLASHGLTVTDVTDAVKEQNKRAAVGTLGKMPADEGQETQSIGRAANRRETPEDFASIILRAEPDGRYVRLGDVAEITNGVRDMNYVSLQDGLETAAFSVALTTDANAVETIGKVNAILAEESRSFPPDMEYRTLVDSTRYVAESMKEVSNTFWEALALVVAIMYLFLRDPRATIIAVLTIPVSLIATFAAFKIAGFSINTLTLFAMVLAIGMVVDD